MAIPLLFVALGATKGGASVVQQGRAGILSAGEQRIWIWDGSTGTYFKFRPLGTKDDAVFAIEANQPAAWDSVIVETERRLSRGNATAIVVGTLAPQAEAKLADLGAAGARIIFARDVDGFVREQVSSFGGELMPILVDERNLGPAAQVASLMRSTSLLPYATTNESVVRDMLATHKVGRGIGIARSFPPTNGAREVSSRWTLADLRQFALRYSGGAWPGDTPPTTYILAVYTGVTLPDSSSCTPIKDPTNPCNDTYGGCTNEALAFYDSTTVASDLCNGRADCILLQMTLQAGWFDTNPSCPNPPYCPPKGWQVEVDSQFDQQIASYVTTFNTNNPLTPITRLAIVSHPLDMPYRRFLFPYYPCGQGCSFVPCDVDSGQTDNTTPRIGLGVVCNGVMDSQMHFDGSTGSADFEYANIKPADPAAYDTADLAYGRIAGQLLSDALMQSCTDRWVLGLGCATPPAALGNGATVVSTSSQHYDLFASLFNDLYVPDALDWCHPPSLPGEFPRCPTLGVYICTAMNYTQTANWLGPLRETGPGALGYELAYAHGHQDFTGEPLSGQNCKLPYITTNVLFPTDRQRVEFAKGPNSSCTFCGAAPYGAPDVETPIISTDTMRRLGAAQLDLAPSIWMLSGSAMGDYNYINRLPRDKCWEDDSSWLSTIIRYGAAGYITRMDVNPSHLFPTPGAHVVPRMLRELTFGKTVGEAMRDIGNHLSSYDPFDPNLVFHYNYMFFGDPDLKLHQTSTPGSDDLVILTAPGPGDDSATAPRVKAFNQDGADLGITNFLAYTTTFGGANVASGDIDGTPDIEIVTGAGWKSTFGPQVRAFTWDGHAIPAVNFMAFSTTDYGVNVGTLDYDNDGMKEIITGLGPGPTFGTSARVFNYDGGSVTQKVSWTPFTPGTAGVNVSGGNLLNLGTNDIGQDGLIGRGPDPISRPGNQAKVFTFTSTAAFGTLVKGPGAGTTIPSTYGLSVAVGQVDEDLFWDDLILGAGQNAGNHGTVEVYRGNGLNQALGTPRYRFDAFAEDSYGVRLGVSDVDRGTPDPLRKEVLTARGPIDPPDPPNFDSGQIKVWDQPSSCSPPCPMTSTLTFSSYDTGVHGRGASVAGFWVDNVGLFSNGSGTRGNGIAATRIATAAEALAPIVTMAQGAEESDFKETGAKSAFLALCSDVGALLDAKSLPGAFAKTEEAREYVDEQVSWKFLQGALDDALGLVKEAIDLEITNRAPVAMLEGPTGPMCPSIYTYSAIDSHDDDDRGLSRNDIQDWVWKLDGVIQPEHDEMASLGIYAGTHLVQVTVVDTFGATGTSSLWVNAADSSAPKGTLQFRVGKVGEDGLVDVHVDPMLQDDCGGSITARLVNVEGSAPDCKVEGAEAGLPDLDFRVSQCEAYEVTYELTDLSGNESALKVPLDVSKEKQP